MYRLGRLASQVERCLLAILVTGLVFRPPEEILAADLSFGFRIDS
jgi:hypothetical protein